MRKSLVFMFSGQGSQYYQMGIELFTENPVFRKWMHKLNDVVYATIGESVLDKLYDEKQRRSQLFDRVLYTHTAIFMVEYALAQVLLECGAEPDFVLGASMGEFASAAVAGVMDVEELLKAVVKQAELFESKCEKGSMLAILDDLRLYRETPLIYENSELAAVNYGAHFVISGGSAKLNDIERFLKDKEIIYQNLPVSYGFHSSLIDPAAPAYIDFLKTKIYRKPQIPFVSCLFGNITTELPGDYFWNVARKPILFPQAIQELENGRNHIYLDLGPGGTLANFAKRNLDDNSRSESFAIITPFNRDLANLERIKDLLPNRRLVRNRTPFKPV